MEGDAMEGRQGHAPLQQVMGRHAQPRMVKTRAVAPNFDGDENKFEMWFVKFTSYLRLQGLHEVINMGDDAPEPDEEENASVFAELVQIIDDKSLGLIMRDARDKGREAMKILIEYYKSNRKPRILALYSELFSSSKHKDETVMDFMLRIETKVAHLKDAGEVFSESLLQAIVLRALPDEFSAFCTINTQEETNFAQFKIRLRAEEERILRQGEANNKNTEIMAMKERRPNSTQDGGIKCYACGEYGHKQYQCPKGDKYCSTCQTKTHNTADCRRSNVKYGQQRTYQAKVCYNEAEEDNTKSHSFTFMVNETEDENSVTMINSLLVDTGASTHIITNKDRFTSFDANFDPKLHTIELADGRRVNDIAKGKGTAEVMITNTQGIPCKAVLRNALFIPSFKQDIFSVQMAVKNGTAMTFKQDGAVMQNNNTSFNIEKRGSLYYLNACNIPSRSLQEWHNILGHCNMNDLMKTEEHVEGMIINDKSKSDCDICIQGKMTQSFNRNPDKRATRPLELVHTDLSGRIEPAGREGFQYAIIFTDDYSGFLTVYFLKNKSDAARATEKYIADVAPFGEIKGMSIRSDNGGEYISDEFNDVMIKNKIYHHTSAPKSPHQNGTAERSWRTLFDMGRCLLIESRLPKNFWTYAVMTAAYNRNRCYNPRIGKSSFEAFKGIKPNIHHMNRFGTNCFAYIYDTKKLDPRAEKGVLVGYDRYSPAFLVYVKERDTVRKVRSVVFSTQNTGNATTEKISPPSRCISTATRMFEFEENAPHIQENHENPAEDHADEPGTEQDTAEEPITRSSQRNKLDKNDYLAQKYKDHVYTTTDYIYMVTPNTFKEAMESEKSKEWKEAIEAEMKSLEKYEVFELVELPENKRPVGCRWTFKIKYDSNGQVEKYKARLVAKGYTQKYGIDYEETFSPVVRSESVRALIAHAAISNKKIHQVDISTAFLNGELDEEVYMKQPDGYTVEGKEKMVYKLKKSLYGLKQSSRCWNETLSKCLIANGLHQAGCDSCMFTGVEGEVVEVHVDDILIVADTDQQISKIKSFLSSSFEVKDLGPLKFYLGINVEQTDNGIWIGQPHFITETLTQHNMSECKPTNTPMAAISNTQDQPGDSKPFDKHTYQSAVGKLLYLSNWTRPDIVYAVNQAAKYCNAPNTTNWANVKRIMRYLKSTKDYGVAYQQHSSPRVVLGYTDADWAGSADRKSTSGYVFMAANGAISWRSKGQATVALSTAEAEYIAMGAAAQEALWQLSLQNELNKENQLESITLLTDSQSAMAMAKNPKYHGRAKHIDIKAHFVRDLVLKRTLNLEYTPTDTMLADIFTKPLNFDKHKFFTEKLGVGPR